MAVRHHIRVLVVDDDQQVCKTVGMILQENGYHIDAFACPEEGIKAVERNAYDIALLDIRMPGMDGLELLKRIREVDPRIAILVMTAYPEIETATETMRLGSRDYITKPFREDQLFQAVERIAREMGLVYTNEQELNRLIGQRIRQERLRQNLTLRQLSERSELTTSQLSQVELGKNAASLWSLARISGALGKQLNEVLAGL